MIERTDSICEVDAAHRDGDIDTYRSPMQSGDVRFGREKVGCREVAAHMDKVHRAGRSDRADQPCPAKPTDGDRLARARHALATAETLAWSGMSARILTERVPDELMQEDPCRSVCGDSSENATDSDRRWHETRQGSVGTRSRKSSEVAPRPRRGKKQRVQQCARDVKRFLTARDAGVIRQGQLREGTEDVACIEVEQQCTHGGSGFQGRHSMPLEGRRHGLSSAQRFSLDRVSLGDEACDLALGGGLVCGALHEISGVWFAGEPPVDPARFADECKIGAGDWIVPFGCLLHIVRRAAAHPALVGRSIAWIGNKVHPPRHMLRMLRQNRDAAMHGAKCASSVGGRLFVDHKLEHELEHRSVFVGDAPNGATRNERLAGGTSPWPTGARHAKKCSRLHEQSHAQSHEQAHEQSHARLWCAELAIRMGASGIIVVDGSGFDHLAWRRLQLAASTVHQCAQDQAEADDGVVSCGPLVLVVTPSAVDSADDETTDRRAPFVRRLARRLRTAATQWSVRAEKAPDSMHTGISNAQQRGDTPFRFQWRMHLTHLRAGHGGQVGVEAEKGEDPAPPSGHQTEVSVERDAGFLHAAIANRELSVLVGLPRTPCAEDAWEVLRGRMPTSQVRDSHDGEQILSLHKLQDRHGARRLAMDEEDDARCSFSMPSNRHAGWEVRSA